MKRTLKATRVKVKRVCYACGSDKTAVRKDNSIPIWNLNKPTGFTLCQNCYYNIISDKDKHHQFVEQWKLKQGPAYHEKRRYVYNLTGKNRKHEHYTENRVKILEYKRIYHARERFSVLFHYSNGTMMCKCCKEATYEFLTIDHTNNDGAAHRKAIGKGKLKIYTWLLKHGLPEGYQVLCFNCNCCKGKLGYCVHESKAGARPDFLQRSRFNKTLSEFIY